MMENTLDGIRVVELASVLAGPAVGQFFAELGAEVIKVENATVGGDVTRQWKVKGEPADKPDSAYFRSVNYGKTFRMHNLKDATDRAQVYQLIETADVVISNFSGAAADRLGMAPATLMELNPRLIVAELSAFGPGEDRPAYDIVLQAETGFLAMSGTRTGELCRMPVALIDLLAAHQLKEGILLALWKRERTGKGALVQASLYDSALGSLANQATNYLIANHLPVPMGTEHPNIAPYGDIFTTADGHRVVLAVGSDRQFNALCAFLELQVPEALTTNAKRVANRQVLVQFLQAALGALRLDFLLDGCLQRKIPLGHVKNMQEVFALPAARDRLLEYPDGQQTVKTVAFTVE